MKQAIKSSKIKIVKKTDCNRLHKSIGYPRNMKGVILNLKTGKYELQE